MRVDIRNDTQIATEIQFTDKQGCYDAFLLKDEEGDSRIRIDAADDYVFVQKADVENMIKALQKAVSLGWTK